MESKPETKKTTIGIYELHWGPTGGRLGTVEARSVSAARRKAPMPYRKYLGEIGVTYLGPKAK